MHTDASKYGTGAMLAQWHDNELRPVRDASRAFTQTESHWPTTAHQELFAVKWAMEHFRPYILGHPVKVITDHANLKRITSIKLQQSKLARWCLYLAEFDFTIEHCPGRVNVVPDTLSRAPVPSSDPRRAQEHAKSCHHFTIKSVEKLPYNPRIWKTLLKAHFQKFVIVFGDCSIFKTMFKKKNR